VFLLPAEVAHSPRRPSGTVGIVVERRRGPEELDGFSWYCENCGHCLYLERVAVANIETELPAIFTRFYSSIERRTCGACGTLMQPPPT
jgi:3-hydroxyanthranilate 3,4-dioxygenase